MPNTRGIAAHQPEEDCGDDETAEDAATVREILRRPRLGRRRDWQVGER